MLTYVTVTNMANPPNSQYGALRKGGHNNDTELGLDSYLKWVQILGTTYKGGSSSLLIH